MHGQIVGMINNLNVPFPAGVSNYINVAAITQLNLEIMQHSCVLGVEEDACARHAHARDAPMRERKAPRARNRYYSKVRMFFWLPVLLVGGLGLVYGAQLARWKLGTSGYQLSSSIAADRSQRFRDQLCSVGCCVFNLLYARIASWRRCIRFAVRNLQGCSYAPMISASWFLYNCKQLDDGTSQLTPAPHLNCYDDAWAAARVYAIMTLALWGILAPLGLAVALHFARIRLRTAEFSRKFALLTFGYKRHCVWWEVRSPFRCCSSSAPLISHRRANCAAFGKPIHAIQRSFRC